MAVLVIAGCGSDGGTVGGSMPGGTFSCRAAFPGADGGAGMLVVCVEATGGTANDVASNRQQCTAQGNTFVLDSCPRDQALGGCRQTTTATAAAITTWYYADEHSTADDIKRLCDSAASIAPPGLTIQFVLP